MKDHTGSLALRVQKASIRHHRMGKFQVIFFQ